MSQFWNENDEEMTKMDTIFGKATRYGKATGGGIVVFVRKGMKIEAENSTAVAALLYTIANAVVKSKR